MSPMTMLKLCFVSLLFSEVNLSNSALSVTNSYGPYYLRWNRYQICSGPKATNLTTYVMDLHKDGDAYVAWMNFTFLIQARIDEVKISVHTVKNNRSNLLMSYKLNNPCQHYAVASIIDKELNATNCVVKKGTYNCFVNFTEISYSFFGKSFFYGEYMLRVTNFSKKGNILCLVLNMIFERKKSP